MATLGSTSKPTSTQEFSNGATNNQIAMDLTFPSGGPWKVTRIGIWVNGSGEVATFKGVVWSNSRNSILGQTAAFNANNEPFGVGNSDLFERDISTPFEVAGGTTVYAGWWCDPDENRQWGRKSTGDHYDDSENSESPQPMAGESLHSAGAIGVYLIYELANEAPVAVSTSLESAASGSILSGSDNLWWLTIIGDDDSVNNISKYDYQIDTTSGNGVAPDWSSLTANVANATAGIGGHDVFTTITHALSRGQWYALRSRIYDDEGLVSAWSPTFYFKVNALPTVGSRTPGSATLAFIHNLRDLALWTSGGAHAKPRFQFTPSDADGQTITKYRLRIYDAAAAGTMVHDTGEVTVSWTQGVNRTVDSTFAIVNGTERWWTIDVFDGIEWAGESSRTAFKMRWAQGLFEHDSSSAASTNWSFLTGTKVEQASVIFRGADTSGGDTATGKGAWQATIAGAIGKRWMQALVRLSTDTAGTSGTLADMTFNYYGTPNTPDGWSVS